MNGNIILFVIASFVVFYFTVALFATVHFYCKYGNINDIINNIINNIEQENKLDYSELHVFEKETQITHDLQEACYMCINTDYRCPKCDFYKEKTTYIKIDFPGLKKYVKTIKFAPLSPAIDKEIKEGVINGVMNKLGYNAEIIHII